MDIRNPFIYSDKKSNIVERIDSESGKEGAKIAEKLMEIYCFHHKFQTKEFIERCNTVWSD